MPENVILSLFKFVLHLLVRSDVLEVGKVVFKTEVSPVQHFGLEVEDELPPDPVIEFVVVQKILHVPSWP